ncbi:MAG: hypothetical protein A4E19_14145 [Nitrospira sp. SG-bin1]|nr:MAG: hypothetical protein A4E19_14145 [Nitrospira sp. SG-bin1]
MISVFACGALLPVFVCAQEAILPQGDPRLQGPEATEQDRREEIRRNRLKQQGQGENYRIEGEPQGGTSRPTPGRTPDSGRQDTGLADPSVNPGQAAGMKSIRGEIVKSENNTHTVRQKSGDDTIFVVDDYTRGDTDLRPGDLISGSLTQQGRAVIVKKEPRSERR